MIASTHSSCFLDLWFPFAAFDHHFLSFSFFFHFIWISADVDGLPDILNIFLCIWNENRGDLMTSPVVAFFCLFKIQFYHFISRSTTYRYQDSILKLTPFEKDGKDNEGWKIIVGFWKINMMIFGLVLHMLYNNENCTICTVIVSTILLLWFSLFANYHILFTAYMSIFL